MKKLIFKLLFSVLSLLTLNLFAQSVVLDTNNVKKPKSGGLYYQKKDKTLYLFREKFEVVNKPLVNIITEIPKEDFFEKEIGAWNNVNGSVLLIKNVDKKLWLFQTDKNRTFYVFRGKNFLSDKNVKLSETIDLDKLSSEVTGIGGLMPAINGNIPKGFNLEKWQNAGFKLNSKGEWVLNLVVDDDNNNNTETQISGNRIKFSADEARLDVLDWSKFSDFKLPNTWKNIGGYGIPFQGADIKTDNGKYIALNKGWTNYRGVTSIGNKRYSPDNRYGFDHPSRLIALAAKQLIGHIEGKAFAEYPNGYTDNGPWGDIKRLIADPNVINYSGLTVEGAEKIGLYSYYQWWTQDALTKEEVWPTAAWMCMDEEHIPDNLGGIGKIQLLASMNKAIKTVSPNINLGWYAMPFHWFYHGHLNAELVYDKEIEDFHLDKKGSVFDISGFKDFGFWFDAGGYVGVPHIREHSKYERNPDGSFKILNGKRIYAKENFFENIYGEKTEFLAEPADWLKYRVDTHGGIKVSSTYFDSNGNLKEEYVAMGWTDNNSRKKNTWEPETKKATDEVYVFADIVTSNILKANQLEYGDNDISRFKVGSKINPYLELRFVTEGGGYGSNSMVSRHKTKELTTFEVLFGYLSGVKSISAFCEGRGYKPNGEVEAISWGGLIHRQEAIHQLAKDLEGTDQSKWRFIHFYYPVALNNRRGVIGVGIYTGEKFVYCLANPSLNFDESQTVEMFIDGKKNNIVINGADLYNYNVISNLKQGLDGTNFNLTYKTIYGKQIKVSGVFDGVLKNTLIEEK